MRSRLQASDYAGRVNVTDRAPNLGLRERNKRQAMAHIQGVALDLFDEHGYAAVSVEQVAAAAGVSPSTVYRYFGTKDRLVLHDEEDRLMVDAFLAALGGGATVIAAARQVLTLITPHLEHEEATLRRRARYMMGEPTVWAAMMLEGRATIDHLTTEVARRRGDRSAEVAVAVAALISTMLVCVEAWWRLDVPVAGLTETLATSLDQLEHGITV